RSSHPAAGVDLLDRCYQPLLEEGQNRPVAYAASDRPHQLRMRDAIEVTAQVGVDHLCMPRPQPLPYLLDGLVSAAAWSVGILLRGQIGTEEGLENQQDRHLHDTTADRGDAQRPLLAVRFG